MAEEWGTVIVKSSDEVMNAVNANGDDLASAKLLAEAGGIAAEKLDSLTLRTEKVTFEHGYLVIRYHCGDFREFSELFARDGNGIELYARTNDEYGTAAFFALNGDGDRIGFWFDEGGDMCEVEGYEEEIRGKIDKWVAALPADLKQNFPGFVATDDIMFDGP